PAEGSGLVSVPLYRERFSIVLPEGHPLAGDTDVTLSQIKDLELLLLDDGHCLRDQIMDLCRRADLNPADATNSITRASSLTTIIQLVLGGLGATLLPESAIATEYTNDKLSLATFRDDVIAEREIGLVVRASAARSEEFSHFGELDVQAFEAAVARSRKVLAEKIGYARYLNHAEQIKSTVEFESTVRLFMRLFLLDHYYRRTILSSGTGPPAIWR